MFDSGITAEDIIGQVNSEADIALPISDECYIQWLNAAERLLYTEIIKEQGMMHVGFAWRPVPGTVTETIDLSKRSAEVSDEEDTPSFEDIYAVYSDGVQLIKSTLTSGGIFPNTYYGNGIYLTVHLSKYPGTVDVYYYVKPKLITLDNMGSRNVMVPVEFIDLIKAKLRGEAYKLVNEREAAAMWLSDYNAQVETFKVWISGRQPTFGI